MKKKIYKMFLILIISLSLGAGPMAQNEIAKMLEALTGISTTQVQEIDEAKESEEIKKKKKKFSNYFKHMS